MQHSWQHLIDPYDFLIRYWERLSPRVVFGLDGVVGHFDVVLLYCASIFSTFTMRYDKAPTPAPPLVDLDLEQKEDLVQVMLEIPKLVIQLKIV